VRKVGPDGSQLH